MTTATATRTRRRRRWTCKGCEVEVRNLDGEPIPVPAGWRKGRCVACLRLDAAQRGGNAAVLRLELLRGTPLRQAAKIAGVAIASAHPLRAGMIRRGELEAPVKAKPIRKPRRAPAAERAAAVLRADPTLSNGSVAARADASANTARRVRLRLSLPKVPASGRGQALRVEAALRADPTLSDHDLACQFGAAPQTVRKARDRLGIAATSA